MGRVLSVIGIDRRTPDALRLPVLKAGVGDEVTVSATRGAVWRSTAACLGEAC
jgi:hypothetical protein